MPAYMTAQKRQDIREAIQAGMSGQEIRQMLNTSAGTITNIKREMGIPIRPMRQTRTRGPVRTVAQPPAGDPLRNLAIAQDYIKRLDAERAASTAPPAPTAPLSPEEYVAAFEARVLEYHALIRAKDIEIERLRKENSTLRSEYQQMVFRQQNWTGPTSTMSQSLGNGC